MDDVSTLKLYAKTLMSLLHCRLYHTLCYTGTSRKRRMLPVTNHVVNDIDVHGVRGSNVGVIHSGL